MDATVGKRHDTTEVQSCLRSKHRAERRTGMAMAMELSRAVQAVDQLNDQANHASDGLYFWVKYKTSEYVGVCGPQQNIQKSLVLVIIFVTM